MSSTTIQDEFSEKTGQYKHRYLDRAAGANHYFRKTLDDDASGLFIISDSVQDDIQNKIVDLDVLIENVVSSESVPERCDAKGLFNVAGISYQWEIWAMKSKPQLGLDGFFMGPSFVPIRTTDPSVEVEDARFVLLRRKNEHLQAGY